MLLSTRLGRKVTLILALNGDFIAESAATERLLDGLVDKEKTF